MKMVKTSVETNDSTTKTTFVSDSPRSKRKENWSSKGTEVWVRSKKSVGT